MIFVVDPGSGEMTGGLQKNGCGSLNKLPLFLSAETAGIPVSHVLRISRQKP